MYILLIVIKGGKMKLRKVLVFIIVVQILMLSSLNVVLSEYVGTSTASSIARVAKIDVTASPTLNETIALASGDTKNYTFNIANSSEVSVTGQLIVQANPNSNTIRLFVGGNEVSVGDKFVLSDNSNTTAMVRIYGGDADSTIKFYWSFEQIN